MEMKHLIPLALTGLLFLPGPSLASIQFLTVGELVEACQEGRNQSEAGRDSEEICHMYLKGYLDAYRAAGQGPLCLPDTITSVADMSDAIFKWGVYNQDKTDQPAAAAIQGAMACP